MDGRTILLYGKRYHWRDTRILRGGLSLVRDEGLAEGTGVETVGPMWPTPCPAWCQEQYAKDVAANRAAIEARLINPEEKTDA